MHRGPNESWKYLMSQGYHDIGALQYLFHFPKEELSSLRGVQQQFPFFVNPYYLSLMDPTDPRDPIRVMSIPTLTETNRNGSFDTSGEHSNTVLPGLQHKYPETALILSTNQCAMYCRHCFRKRLVGLSENEAVKNLRDITAYIRRHREINNVLITGGDAFMNSNDTISKYLEALSDIPHLDLIRFGTRTPAVLPQRITTDMELLSILGRHSDKHQRIYVVTQFNHPREVTREAAAAVSCLLALGIPVRNQTVLLRGVNDSRETLSSLIRRLTTIGVVPYYIFQCRPVTGVMNQFQVPLRDGYELVQAVADRQSGMGKCFRFMLSHVTGKIEILGLQDDGRMVFKYHQAKDPLNRGRMFTQAIDPDQCWL